MAECQNDRSENVGARLHWSTFWDDTFSEVVVGSDQWHTDHRFSSSGSTKSSQVHFICKKCIVHRKLWFVCTGSFVAMIIFMNTLWARSSWCCCKFWRCCCCLFCPHSFCHLYDHQFFFVNEVAKNYPYVTSSRWYNISGDDNTIIMMMINNVRLKYKKETQLWLVCQAPCLSEQVGRG